MPETLAILGGTPIRTAKFPMEMPTIENDDISAVIQVLEEKRLSLFSSPRVTEFEEQFAKYIGTKYAIAVNSGTAALHSALVALGVGAGDEVIVPVYTHMSTANAVLMQNAVPVFVDIDLDTYNISVEEIGQYISDKTRAIIIVDLFGNPVDREAVLHIASQFNLPVVEDCAQSTGASVNGRKVGSFGIGCHSFGEIKNITSAEGGMITTNDSEVCCRARLMRHEGEMWRSQRVSIIHGLPKTFDELINGIDYSFIGHNYRLSALQAALGISQLRKLDRLNEMRIQNAYYYIQDLADIPEIILPKVKHNVKHVFNRFAIRVKDTIGVSRNAFLAALISEGIPAGVYYPIPLSRYLVFTEKRGYGTSTCPFSCRYARSVSYVQSFPRAERVCQEEIILPVYPSLSKQDLHDVVKAVRKVCQALKDKAIAQAVESVASAIKATYFGQFLTVRS